MEDKGGGRPRQKELCKIWDMKIEQFNDIWVLWGLRVEIDSYVKEYFIHWWSLLEN